MHAPIGLARDLLDQILKDELPANVDRDSVTLTGEGPGEAIFLIPHQDLGGYSLALWFSDEWIELGWASVIDLEYHDELDLGRVIAKFDGGGWVRDDVVRAAIRAEMHRPIRVRLRKTRVFRRWQLLCAVEVGGMWAETWACNVPTSDVDASDRFVDAGITSLAGPARPTMRCPVPIDRWRRYAEPAWPHESST